MRISNLVIVCALMTVGCESPPEPLPPVHPKNPDAVAPPTSHLPVSLALINIQRIALPLDLPTDPAWEVIDENAFPQITQSVWNANGLRVGLVSRSKLEAMAKALPQAQGVQNSRTLGSDHPTPVRRSPRLRGVVTVDLTIPPMSVREQQITGGHVQLLMHLDRNGSFYLVPHHHVLQTTLLPRSALEKELEGQVFRELSIGTRLNGQDVLAVGLYRPWPLMAAEEQTPPEDEPGNPALTPETADTTPVYDLSNTPALANNLGRALLTGGLNHQPTQTLLLITLEPLRTSHE